MKRSSVAESLEKSSQPAYVAVSVELRHKLLLFKTGAFKNSLGCCIIGVYEALKFASAVLSPRHLKAKSYEFGCITVAPGRSVEMISNLDTPTWFERIVINSTEADDLPRASFNHGPRPISVFPTLTFVPYNMTPARTNILECQSISHCVTVGEESQKCASMRKARPE